MVKNQLDISNFPEYNDMNESFKSVLKNDDPFIDWWDQYIYLN